MTESKDSDDSVVARGRSQHKAQGVGTFGPMRPLVLTWTT